MIDGTTTVSMVFLITIIGVVCSALSTRATLQKDRDGRIKEREEKIKSDTIRDTRIDTKLERIAIDTSDIKTSLDNINHKIEDHERRISYIEMKEKFKEERENYED